jgi:hypothetical protein
MGPDITFFRRKKKRYRQAVWQNRLKNVHVHPNLLPTPGVVSKRDYNLMPRGAYWPRLSNDGYHHSIRHANDVTS